jgi:dTDP-4-amino-4,6-dideoxygalactose transaminase
MRSHGVERDAAQASRIWTARLSPGPMRCRRWAIITACRTSIAALGRSQLAKLPAFRAAPARLAALYVEALAPLAPLVKRQRFSPVSIRAGI